MKRIRANRGNLYPTGGTKRAGHPDKRYDYICSKCGKKILKQESQMSIPGESGVKRYHWDCKPDVKEREK